MYSKVTHTPAVGARASCLISWGCSIYFKINLIKISTSCYKRSSHEHVVLSVLVTTASAVPRTRPVTQQVSGRCLSNEGRKEGTGQGLFPLRTHSLRRRKTRNRPAWCSSDPQVGPSSNPGCEGGLPRRDDAMLSLKEGQESEGNPKQKGKEWDKRVDGYEASGGSRGKNAGIHPSHAGQ